MKYKVGDILKIKEGCRGNCPVCDEPNVEYICISGLGSAGYFYEALDKDKKPTGDVCSHCYTDEYLEPLTETKSFMSNIKSFIKNLTLSADEKLLRKHGLKGDCGEYTQDARDAVLDKMCKDNEAYLIEIAQGLEKESNK